MMDNLDNAMLVRIDRACDAFEAAWNAGQRPRVEEVLGNFPAEAHPVLLRELLPIEWDFRRQAGEEPELAEYLARFPDLAEWLPVALGHRDTASSVQAAGGGSPLSSTGPEAPPPSPAAVPEACPQRLGRYRILSRLGKGSFKIVYKGYDEELQRPVAIMVPRPDRVALPQDRAMFLTEAQVLARLDHPHIVRVHDVGHTDDGQPFVVSSFIEGSDLKMRLTQGPLSPVEAAALVACIADALHHAHRKRLVHRDVKPGNILLDRAGTPYLADFGLALREEDIGRHGAGAGTAAYMSPEQARREGHRVDGRSDIFSLGVVFYELLTGKLPFHAETMAELLDLIATAEARPPRQLDEAIPRELERICLKALARLTSERYTTATDLAEDLQHFLAAQAARPPAAAAARDPEALSPSATPPPASAATPTPPPDSAPIRVVPRGLRSFEAQDADFFLELLPGPRDRQGLPDNIRFWKTRIEETDPDSTFAVGLIYGPSGCGKSSLVKAGLLPQLAGHILSVYVEATADQTEARVLAGLRKRCPAVPVEGGLKGALAALRRGQGWPPGKKVLLVLDQFEQWLHAKREEQDTELVQALRQCDGGRVQCLALVRDDFWMAVTRFLRELDIRLVEGQNSLALDLFPANHAEKILAAFGRAFTVLPDHPAKVTGDQKLFLSQAIRGLAQEGKVVCVRLALFAEMMKGRPWTPAVLKEVGGTEGVGVTFLEETFSAAGAPPEHRLHQKAARAVLRELLPETGTDIKGHLRSDGELLAASGYAGRPRDFGDLLRILDSEVRLLTPTEPETQQSEEGPPSAVPSGRKYYQLTHDYLVPSLREWLTRKQKETRRGRAELRLAERTALWNSKPESRHLPAWWEWLNIRLFTRKRDWSPPQQKMMRKAALYHAVRGLALATSLLLLLGAGWEVHGRLRAKALMDNLLRAPTEDVPAIVRDMGSYRRWLNGPLLQAYAEAEANGEARKQLHASLALLPVDSGQVDYLNERLLSAGPQEVLVIRSELQPHAEAVAEYLWPVLEDRKRDGGERLRAACALAVYAGTDGRWGKVGGDVAGRLVAENAFVMAQWADALRPVQGFLLPPLAGLLLEEGRGAAQRRLIARIYAGYAEDVPNAFLPLEKVLAEPNAPGANLNARLALARRQASAATALAAAGQWDKIRPLLGQGPDPTVGTHLIAELAGMVEARVLVGMLVPDAEASLRQGIILALGQFDRDRLSPAERALHLPKLVEIYRDDPDPGVHGAAGWLLRHWGQQEKLAEIDLAAMRKPVETLPGLRREVIVKLADNVLLELVLIRPGSFVMGENNSCLTEEDERPAHKVTISRAFYLGKYPVTQEQWQAVMGSNPSYYMDVKNPMEMVSWEDCQAFLKKLNEKAGKTLGTFRLPTEAEWEYACRAGSTTMYSFGDEEGSLGDYGWFFGNSMGRTHPAGERKPNVWGLYDMHGNVCQWCQDRYGAYPALEQMDPQGTAQGSYRVIRGGSWNFNGQNCRSANRLGHGPGDRFNSLGFRLALVPSGSGK